MCKLLNISRSSLYYAKNKPAKKYNAEEEKLTQHIKEIFKNNTNYIINIAHNLKNC